jgi:hypothetical protein
VADVVEVLQHWQAGRSTRALARSLGMGRDRVRAIVARAEAAGLAPAGPPLSREEWEKHVPDRFAARLTPPGRRRGSCSPVFTRRSSAGWTNTERTVWQRLRDERGLTVSESTFRRYVEAHAREGVRRERITVRKEVTPPGQVAEVDYECLGRWTNPRTGNRRAVHGFVMTLASSRLHVVDVVLSSRRAWRSERPVARLTFPAVTSRPLALARRRSRTTVARASSAVILPAMSGALRRPVVSAVTGNDRRTSRTTVAQAPPPRSSSRPRPALGRELARDRPGPAPWPPQCPLQRRPHGHQHGHPAARTRPLAGQRRGRPRRPRTAGRDRRTVRHRWRRRRGGCKWLLLVLELTGLHRAEEGEPERDVDSGRPGVRRHGDRVATRADHVPGQRDERRGAGPGLTGRPSRRRANAMASAVQATATKSTARGQSAASRRRTRAARRGAGGRSRRG